MSVTSPFLRLGGVRAPFALGRVAEADAVYTGPRELTAWGHWILGGDGASLTESGNGAALAPMGAAPGWEATHAVVALEDGAALQTGYVPPANPRVTMTAVARLPSRSGLNFVLGNRTGSEGLGCWWDSSGVLKVSLRGTSHGFAGASLAEDTWYFVAASWQPGAAESTALYVGGAGLERYANAQPYLSQGAAMGFGNVGYGVTTTNVLHLAEACLFDKILAAPDLDAVYARAKARLAPRGIAVA